MAGRFGPRRLVTGATATKNSRATVSLPVPLVDHVTARDPA